MTKEEVINELHNLRELRTMTTRVLKEKDLKVFATIAGRRFTEGNELFIHVAETLGTILILLRIKRKTINRRVRTLPL